MIPPTVHQGLSAVAGLRKGRTEAKESEGVGPVPDAFVDAIRPHVSRQVWAMIELQRLTGCRPGEVAIMRTRDIDVTGRIWVFTPQSHKMQHKDRERQIYIGPQAQEILKPWLRTDLDGYLFQPRESMAEHLAEPRASRTGPRPPSHLARKPKADPKKKPGEHYTSYTYRNAVYRGCAWAFPCPGISEIKDKDRTPAQWAELKEWNREHAWHPNQLRHNAATRLRKDFGIDVARVILGHSSPTVTEIYAEVDREKAIRIMEQVG